MRSLREVAHAFRPKRRTSVDGCPEQRTVEYGTRRNRKLRCDAAPARKRHVCPSRAILERDVADRHRLDVRCIDRIADQIERPLRDTTSAWLLARMAAVEDRDPHSGACETPR
jgi:hypothetical protein